MDITGQDGTTIGITIEETVQPIADIVGKPGARIAHAVARVVVELRPVPETVAVMGSGQTLSRGIVAKFV